MNTIKVCDYGCRGKAKYLLKNGKWSCCVNVASCPNLREKNSRWHKGKTPNWKLGHPRGMLGKQTWNKDFTEDDYIKKFGIDRWNEIKKRGYETKKKNNSFNNWDKMTDKQKEKFKKDRSKDIRRRYEHGWLPKAGRCKKIQYKSPIAGKVRVDGFWELLVAIYFDSKKYNWERNIKRFNYINLNNKESNYTPDFWVQNLQSYIEVKGYENELTKCKLKQFKDKIQIYKEDKIREIEKELKITINQLKNKYKNTEDVIELTKIFK